MKDQTLIKFIYVSKIHLHQLLINGREKVEIKKLSPKIFIDYSQQLMMFMKIWKNIIQRKLVF